MSTRKSFVEHFGEDQATKIEGAAQEHKNGVHDKTGSDPFRWAVAICIGFQCLEKESFRAYHGITLPFDDFKTWVIDHGDLANHDGDFDYLAMLAGVYTDFIKEI
jgi:hypothetical protein